MSPSITFARLHPGRLWPRPQDGTPATLVSGFVGVDLELADGATHYGFVSRGPATLHAGQGDFRLTSGMYFALPGAGSVSGGDGFVVSQAGHRALFAVGGPIEAHGRLRYIDGCSDSLLLSPARRGDPCLNLLCFPAHTTQTRHTHPSLRAGIVAHGSGACVQATGATPLTPGLVFVIPPQCEHAFVTTDETLAVIAYHPDSDTGPSDDDHPMLNRTFIAGVSAAARRRAASAPDATRTDAAANLEVMARRHQR